MTATSPHRRRRDAHGGDEHEGGMERWLLTYADMITLLLALFVVLFAIASVNKAKLQLVSRSITHSLNSGGIGAPIPPPAAATHDTQSALPHGPASPTTTAPPTHPAATSSLAALEQQVRRALAAKGLLGDVDLQQRPDGLVIRLLANKLFYASDSATLTAVGQQVVDTTGGVLAGHPNDVDVQGYTDDAPVVGGPYFSNWELSSMRAVEVVLRLDQVDRVNPGQLVAEGYGAAHPLVPNSSPANMAQNRRVDIVVLATDHTQQ